MTESVTQTPFSTTQDAATVVVSGIQPSGTLHLGNYFGALRQHIALGGNPDVRPDEAYYFIVNYHALTTVHDREALRRYTLDVALDYLALGFDPTKAHLFLQSDVPQVNELAWIFYTLTPVSQLEKGVAYKDKVAQGLTANAGLFNYPILQAADILIYGGTLVPVGADQKQNIEISRDLAQKFNAAFCTGPDGELDDPIFSIPEPHILEDVAVVPGIDGRKMSKSYGNTIGLFDEGKSLKKKVMSIVTDSTPLEAPKTPKPITSSPCSGFSPTRPSRLRLQPRTTRAATATATPKKNYSASSPITSPKLASAAAPLPTTRTM